METDSPVVYHGTSESRFPNDAKKQIEVRILCSLLYVNWNKLV